MPAKDQVAPRAIRVKEFCEAYRVSRATAFRLMAAGQLDYRKPSPFLRLITTESAERWFNSLPGRPTGDTLVG